MRVDGAGAVTGVGGAVLSGVILLMALGAPASAAAIDPWAEANAAAATGAWDAVVSICTRWEQAAPRELRAPLCIAQGQVNRGHFAEAEAAARRALAIQETAVVRHYQGVASFQLGRFAEAQAALERAVALDPEDPSHRDWLGQALAAQGRYREARGQAEVEKRLAPSRFGADDRLEFWTIAASWTFPAEALRRHGSAGWLMKQGRYREAAAELEAALKAAPTFADAHYHLGWCHSQLAEAALAEQEYRRAIAAYPPAEDQLKAAALHNLSGLLLERRATGEALAAARQAIAIKGDRWYLVLALAAACHQAGDEACSVQAYRTVLRSHEGVPEEIRREVRRALDARDEAPPDKEFTKVSLKVAPAAHERCEHGLMLMEQRRAKDAIVDLEEGLRIQPGHGKCRADLAGALVMTGDLARAEREVRRARAEPHTPVDGEWRGAAAMLLAQLLTAGPGRGAEAGKEGLALLDEAAGVGMDQPSSRRMLLRGIFCDWSGRRGCAIEAFDAYLAAPDEQPPEVRKRIQDRLAVLKREAAAGR